LAWTGSDSFSSEVHQLPTWSLMKSNIFSVFLCSLSVGWLHSKMAKRNKKFLMKHKDPKL
jgi:hypothetical protein